jgi:hypothetical protein
MWFLSDNPGLDFKPFCWYQQNGRTGSKNKKFLNKYFVLRKFTTFAALLFFWLRF